MTSDVFLTALRVTDNQEELIATGDMVGREIAQLVRHLVYKSECKLMGYQSTSMCNQYGLDMTALFSADDIVLPHDTFMFLLTFLPDRAKFLA
jgi:hypothetical protein